MSYKWSVLLLLLPFTNLAFSNTPFAKLIHMYVLTELCSTNWLSLVMAPLGDFAWDGCFCCHCGCWTTSGCSSRSGSGVSETSSDYQMNLFIDLNLWVNYVPWKEELSLPEVVVEIGQCHFHWARWLVLPPLAFFVFSFEVYLFLHLSLHIPCN